MSKKHAMQRNSQTVTTIGDYKHRSTVRESIHNSHRPDLRRRKKQHHRTEQRTDKRKKKKGERRRRARTVGVVDEFLGRVNHYCEYEIDQNLRIGEARM